MTANFPVSIVTHGLGLNVTIQSYNGSLDYGLIACKSTVPDLGAFASAMRASHAELLALVAADAAPAPAKPAPKPAGTKQKPKAKAVKKTVAKPKAKTAAKKVPLVVKKLSRAKVKTNK